MFRRPQDLAVMPASVAILSKLMAAHASADLFERAILADVALATRFARHFGSFNTQTGTRSCDIYDAVQRISESTIKSFVSNLTISGAVATYNTTPRFDYQKFTKHSRFVGAYCAAFANECDELDLTPSEAFSYGLLHDIGTLMLHKINAAAFDQVQEFGVQCGIGFDIAFSCQHNATIHQLGASVIDAWKLSPGLVDALACFEDATDAAWPNIRALMRIGDWHSAHAGAAWEGYAAAMALPPGYELIYREHQSTFDRLADIAAEYLKGGTIRRERDIAA